MLGLLRVQGALSLKMAGLSARKTHEDTIHCALRPAITAPSAFLAPEGSAAASAARRLLLLLLLLGLDFRLHVLDALPDVLRHGDSALHLGHNAPGAFFGYLHHVELVAGAFQEELHVVAHLDKRLAVLQQRFVSSSSSGFSSLSSRWLVTSSCMALREMKADSENRLIILSATKATAAKACPTLEIGTSSLQEYSLSTHRSA